MTKKNNKPRTTRGNEGAVSAAPPSIAAIVPSLFNPNLQIQIE
jgi:hypothetical protein